MTHSETKRIRLLVVSQYYYPEQFRINDMCAEWVKRGYDVTVITGIPNYPQGKFYKGYGWLSKRNETHSGVSIIRLPIISRGTSKFRLALNYLSFVASGFLWQVLTKQHADLVFSFEVSPMSQVLPAVWFAKRRNIPCMVYVQDLWPENLQEVMGVRTGPVVNLVTKMTDYIYRQCQLILVTSNSFKIAIEDKGVTPEKVMFWPQYAEDFYKPSELVSPLVPPDERFTIAFTGNIGTSQGLEILPKTATLLKAKSVHIRFLLVGDGRGMPALKESIADEKVEEYFSFIPPQPPQDIPAVLAAVDAAFISFADNPLFSMTIPAKLQSYMACGMPIIASAGGETMEIVQISGCGYVSPPADAVSLGGIIQKLIGLSSFDREKLGINALEYSKKHFNKRLLMDKMDTLLNYYSSNITDEHALTSYKESTPESEPYEMEPMNSNENFGE